MVSSCRPGLHLITQPFIVTQISLSELEYQAAKREAARLGISLAELLRRSLRGHHLGR
jgi:hypothetical protein